MPSSFHESIETIALLLIVAQHTWDTEEMHTPSAAVYEILADGTPEVITPAPPGTGPCVRFVLKHGQLATVAARVPIGLVETALITRALLEAYRPAIAVQVGFGGIISDDLRLGDVAVASQVDCYLTKNKIAGKQRAALAFAGEVFRPSLSLVQIAQNLRFAHPDEFAAYQREVREAAPRFRIHRDEGSQCWPLLRSRDTTSDQASAIHAVHFACGEIVSTTSAAVDWLKSRDRKLAIIEMESGGFLAAVEQYCHRRKRHVETMVIRGAGGYGDHRHDTVVRANRREIHRMAFENACRFLCRVLGARNLLPTTVSGPPAPAVDVSIMIPLEEEFAYFTALLRDHASTFFQREYREGRYYYRFTVGKLRCAATFVGDMGLVRMALAAEDAYRAFHPRLLVVLGIAAAVAPEIKICDVFVARAVDLYLHRARNRMGGGSTLKASAELAIASLRTDSPIETTQRLVDFIMSDARFERDREAWKAEAAGDLDAALAAIGPLQREAHAVTIAPSVHAGTLASGEWLAAATELVEVLRARGCGAAEMEAGGAAVVRQRLGDESLPRGAPDILLIRGISDHGDENKQSLEKVGQPGMFRRLCARNASRLLLRLLANEDFAASMT